MSRAGIFAAARCLAVLVVLAAIPQAPAQRPAAGRFEVVDVYVASDEPLAAWQFELAERSGRMQVVGVEGGETEVFSEPGYYDRDAVQRGADRVIVASFSLDAPAALPVGRTRVASVHVRLTDTPQPDYDLRLVAAGAVDGDAIHAEISLDTRTGR